MFEAKKHVQDKEWSVCFSFRMKLKKLRFIQYAYNVAYNDYQEKAA